MNPNHCQHHQVIIIGAGAAGLTAAIYAARANLNPMVIQGFEPQKQLLTTIELENYPGFEEGILSPKLMEIFQTQVACLGTEIYQGTVTAVEFSQPPFRIIVDDRQTFTAPAIIIATGATINKLGIENEAKLIGKGVSYCPTCDGSLFQDREIAVVGGGDTAIEDALFLTRFASRIYVIHRRDKLRASTILQERAFANEKITFIWNTEVEKILGEDRVEGVTLRNLNHQETSDLAIKGLFVAIGYQPNTEIFRGWLEMSDRGYIKTECDSTKTNIPGVFACGNAQDWLYRQAITAAGTGCMAAIDAEHWLQSQALTR